MVGSRIRGDHHHRRRQRASLERPRRPRRGCGRRAAGRRVRGSRCPRRAHRGRQHRSGQLRGRGDPVSGGQGAHPGLRGGPSGSDPRPATFSTGRSCSRSGSPAAAIARRSRTSSTPSTGATRTASTSSASTPATTAMTSPDLIADRRLDASRRARRRRRPVRPVQGGRLPDVHLRLPGRDRRGVDRRRARRGRALGATSISCSPRPPSALRGCARPRWPKRSHRPRLSPSSSRAGWHPSSSASIPVCSSARPPRRSAPRRSSRALKNRLATSATGGRAARRSSSASGRSRGPTASSSATSGSTPTPRRPPSSRSPSTACATATSTARTGSRTRCGSRSRRSGWPSRRSTPSALEGRLGLRLSVQGERLDGRATPLESGRIVLADDRRALGFLFGAMAADAEPTRRTERTTFAAIGVKGVPDVALDEALWVASTSALA